MNISISRNGVEIGEWPEEQVHSLYKEGQLLPTDYYWKEGMTEWIELNKMIKSTPPVVRKMVVKTQVITVADNKFVQKKVVPIRPNIVGNQMGRSPDSPEKVDENPSWSVRLLRKLFSKRH